MTGQPYENPAAPEIGAAALAPSDGMIAPPMTIDGAAPAPAARGAAATIGLPIGLLILVSMVQPIAMNMYVPAMARMQADLATSSAAISSTLSVFLMATALAQLVVGPLSDILGRRPVLLAGLSVFVVGSVVCTFAPSVPILIAGRIVQAIGGCAGLALSRAMIRDVYGTGAAASAIGYVTMGMAVAPMVTPAIGGVIAEVASWRLIFAFMGIFAVAATIAAGLGLVETHRPSGRSGALRQFGREAGELLALGSFWLFISTLALLCVAFFGFVAGGVFVSEAVFGLSASAYGLFFMIVAFGYIIGNFVTGRFGERFGLVRMIVTGNAITCAGVSVAALSALVEGAHPLSFFGPMFFVGLGNGFALPNAVAGAVSVRPHLAGTASGIAGAFQMGGGALASVVVGLLCDADPWPGTLWPVVVPMLVGAVSALGLSLFLRQDSVR